MAKGTKKMAGPDLSVLIEIMGLDWVIQQVGPKKLAKELGMRRIIDEVGGVERIWAELTPEERKQLKGFLEKEK